jgi:phosphoglycolate phosphatase
MLNAILFDLDGTLVDSAPDLHAAIARMLDDLQRPALSLEQVTSFIGNGVERLVERSLNATGGPGDTQKAQALFSAHYARDPARLSRLNPGVQSALSQLHAQGIALGVCTNKPQALAETIVGRFALLPFIGAIVGGDGVRALKPDPAPLQDCLKQLRAHAEATLYVGDSEVDEEAATRAALPFALFTGGYRSKAAAAMRTAFVFDQFEQLADWALGPGPEFR